MFIFELMYWVSFHLETSPEGSLILSCYMYEDFESSVWHEPAVALIGKYLYRLSTLLCCFSQCRTLLPNVS